MVCEYIDKMMVITKHYFSDHLKSLEKVLQTPAEAGLKANLEKSFFRITETKCIGLWVSKNVLSLLLYKLYVIKAIGVPIKVHGVCQILGIISFYRDIWCKIAHTLASIIKLCSNKINFKWNDVEHN